MVKLTYLYSSFRQSDLHSHLLPAKEKEKENKNEIKRSLQHQGLSQRRSLLFHFPSFVPRWGEATGGGQGGEDPRGVGCLHLPLISTSLIPVKLLSPLQGVNDNATVALWPLLCTRERAHARQNTHYTCNGWSQVYYFCAMWIRQ